MFSNLLIVKVRKKSSESIYLPHLVPVLPSNRKQSIDLHSKSISVWGQHWHLMGYSEKHAETKRKELSQGSRNPGDSPLL